MSDVALVPYANSMVGHGAGMAVVQAATVNGACVEVFVVGSTLRTEIGGHITLSRVGGVRGPWCRGIPLRRRPNIGARRITARPTDLMGCGQALWL